MVKAPIFQTSLTSIEHFEENEERQYFDFIAEEIPIQLNGSQRVEFNGCQFKRIDFSQVNFERSSFIDCQFVHCDFSNADLSSSLLRRVVFEHCNLVGIDCSRTSFQDVTVKLSQAAYGNFSFSTWKEASIQQCKMDEASFNECHFKNIKLHETSFVSCEFLHASLKDVDFSSCEIEGIQLCGDELKGVIVNEFQALSLARILGILIK